MAADVLANGASRPRLRHVPPNSGISCGSADRSRAPIRRIAAAVHHSHAAIANPPALNAASIAAGGNPGLPAENAMA
jgi:hypothetical protein